MMMTSFAGVPARKMRPTKKHRLAIYAGILGTVYAVNEDGDVEYFDYDLEGARAFAGIVADSDPRIGKPDNYRYTNSDGYEPRKGQNALWVLKTTTNEGATT